MQKNPGSDLLKSPQPKSSAMDVATNKPKKSPNSSPISSPSNRFFFGLTTKSSSTNANNKADDLNSDFNRQLKLATEPTDDQQKKHPSPSSSSLASTSSYSANIPNQAKVLQSYTAITEDEISVQKGDTVQIITANLHNRYLVHHESGDTHLAAEGWIPGYVIGIPTNNNNNNNTSKV
jgi:hypothetical protein